ncbi:MAG: hypothetical protein QOJ99_4723, partial [Bryobacterales bacterium]|nr:hypothetical protein [Bryobacterales bacterium]
ANGDALVGVDVVVDFNTARLAICGDRA